MNDEYGELPGEARDAIAALLRDVADNIETTETFGEYEMRNDIEQHSVGLFRVEHKVVGRSFELDIKSERFDVDMNLYDKRPERDNDV